MTVGRRPVWRLWLATTDFVHGTFIELYNDGAAFTVTVRPDEGDDVIVIKPRDLES